LTECSIGELRILVNNKIVITAHGKVSASGSKIHALSVGFTPAKVFDVWFDELAVLVLTLGEL